MINISRSFLCSKGIRQVAMLGMADNIGLAVFGRQNRLILETTNDYSLILEHIGKTIDKWLMKI